MGVLAVGPDSGVIYGNLDYALKQKEDPFQLHFPQ